MVVDSRASVHVTLLAAAVALALGTSACGDSDDSSGGDGGSATNAAAVQGVDERAIRATFDEFKDAYFSGDAEAGCAAMTEVAQAQFAALGSEDSATCEDRFEQIVALNRTGKPGDPKPEVVAVRVDGDTAVLVTRAPDNGRKARANFLKEDGEWKMNSAFSQ